MVLFRGLYCPVSRFPHCLNGLRKVSKPCFKLSTKSHFPPLTHLRRPSRLQRLNRTPLLLLTPSRSGRPFYHSSLLALVTTVKEDPLG